MPVHDTEITKSLDNSISENKLNIYVKYLMNSNGIDKHFNFAKQRWCDSIVLVRYNRYRLIHVYTYTIENVSVKSCLHNEHNIFIIKYQNVNVTLL